MHPRAHNFIPAALALLALALPTAASAHQSPAGCTTGGLHPSLTGLETIKRNGDVVTITPRLDNDGPNFCDFTDVDVTIQLPKPDGTLGDPIPVASGLDFPNGTPRTDLGPVQYTVKLDSGIQKAPVKMSFAGVGHFADPDSPKGPLGSLQTNVHVTRPHVKLSVNPVASSGAAPFGVTYKYEAENDSGLESAGPNFPGMFPVDIVDDRCSPVTFVDGDTIPSSPAILDRGEKWAFTCSTIFQKPGVFTNHVTLNGTSTRDGRPFDQATAQSTVTATGPNMKIAMSHAQQFTRGDTGRGYSIDTRNAGTDPSTGAATVTATVPAGLSAIALSGNGWSCDAAALTCTRNDNLAAGAAYPPIELTVNVGEDAPSNVVATATIARAGDGDTDDNLATDPTDIAGKATGGGNGGTGCTVPKVKKGSKIGAAKRALAAAGCAPGKVIKAKSRKIAKGKLVKLNPGPGTVVPAGGTVGLVKSRG